MTAADAAELAARATPERRGALLDFLLSFHGGEARHHVYTEVLDATQQRDAVRALADRSGNPLDEERVELIRGLWMRPEAWW